MTPRRVVFDTNVLCSALLFRGGSVAWLRLAWQRQAIRPLASRATVEELIRVIAYPKFALDAAARDDILADYLPWCETVAVPAGIDLPECRDPHDLKFLALARVGEADALITGDGDLLALKDAFEIPIRTPGEARHWLAVH